MSILCWGNRRLLLQSDEGTKVARRHPSIVGKAVAAKGVFSLVFLEESRVFKLTIDRVAMEMAESQLRWCCPALPTILKVHRAIGKIACGIELHLIEMEPLTRIPIGSSARKECYKIAKPLRYSVEDHLSDSTKLGVTRESQSVGPIKDALALLAEFSGRMDDRAQLDLHLSNFMWRADGSQIVITDPFVDLEVRHIYLKAYATKAGLGPDVEIM